MTLIRILKVSRASYLLALVLFMITSCGLQKNGCTKITEATKPETVAQKANNPVFTDLPALDLNKLSLEQRQSFIQFANEEICPCDCPSSFAGCLQNDEQCKPAVLLGKWVLNLLSQGLTIDMLAEPLAKEIGLGFRARPQIIDIDGFSVKGAKNPTVSIIEFADFECAHCKTTAIALDALVAKNTEDVNLIFKHFPLPIHPDSKAAAIAAEAAALQNQFWPMHHQFFTATRALDENSIIATAKKCGITGAKLDKFKADLTNKAVIAKVNNSMAEAKLLGLNGTPSLFFNGRPYFLSLDLSGLELRLAMEKARNEMICETK